MNFCRVLHGVKKSFIHPTKLHCFTHRIHLHLSYTNIVIKYSFCLLVLDLVKTKKKMASGGAKSSYTQFLQQIDKSLKPYITGDSESIAQQEDRAASVRKSLDALIAEAKEIGGLPPGELNVFGSFSNGFKTGGSDLDIVYISEEVSQQNAVRILQTIMNLADKYGFDNITKIFQANVPILKFSDKDSGIEVRAF